MRNYLASVWLLLYLLLVPIDLGPGEDEKWVLECGVERKPPNPKPNTYTYIIWNMQTLGLGFIDVYSILDFGGPQTLNPKP